MRPKLSIEKRTELLRLLKAAVDLREQDWDAQRDFELELGKNVDGLSGMIDDLAVAGMDSVTEKNLNDILSEGWKKSYA